MDVSPWDHSYVTEHISAGTVPSHPLWTSGQDGRRHLGYIHVCVWKGQETSTFRKGV